MSFLTDIRKLHDFVTLIKTDFLSHYPQIGENQYDYAVAVYNLI